MREEDLRYLKKKHAHLLDNDTEKDDRSARDNDVEMEAEEPQESRLPWLLLMPLPISSVLLLKYLIEPGPQTKADSRESRIVNFILKFFRMAIGICGCVMACLWVLWPIFIELITTDTPHVNHALSTLSVLIMLLCCVWCIFVFLYSIFGGKKEKKFRLSAYVILVTMLLGIWLDPIARHVHTANQFFYFMTGILVAFICMFPRARSGMRLYIFFLFIVLILNQTGDVSI